MPKIFEMKRLLILLFLCFTLFSCVNEKKEIEAVLVLDEEHSIGENGISLVPIVNKVEEKELKLKSDSQEGTTLKLEFEVELETDEELHYSINNGNVERSKDAPIELELLEGNNVVFVCISNGVGVSSTFWVKNYFVGEGVGSFERNESHLFQNFIRLNDGIVIDYQIMNEKPGFQAVLQLDSIRYLLTPNITYLLSEKREVRLILLNGEGDLIDGPFNDTGVISVEVK